MFSKKNNFLTKSIRFKLLTLLLSTILITTSIFSYLSITSLRAGTERDMEEFKKSAYAARKAELKSEVNIAVQAVEGVYREGTAKSEDLKKSSRHS